MLPPIIENVSNKNRHQLIDVLMLAFSTDPVGRFGFVTPTQYLHGMRIIFEATATASIESKGAWLTEGAGAMWLAPGKHAAEEGMADLAQHLEPSRVDAMGELLGQMNASHPDEPHWYLNFIGVDTHQQGQGLGSAILKTSLLPVDEQGAIAYLESSNPANVPLYERFGFEVTGEIQVKDSPVVYPMVRPAQK
jgi:GNAT superfamily N-acetyltransferase